MVSLPGHNCVSVSPRRSWMHCAAFRCTGKIKQGLSGCISRWEEERYTDGSKWKFLEHKGPVFAPPYEPLPSNVKFYYDGRVSVNAAHTVGLLGSSATAHQTDKYVRPGHFQVST